MNIPKIKKMADRVVDHMTAKSYFAENIGRTDPEKVIDKLYKGLKLPKEDKDLLDVIVRLRVDCGTNRMRAVVTDIIKTELKPLKDDIKIIKDEVGLNGEDKTG